MILGLIGMWFWGATSSQLGMWFLIHVQNSGSTFKRQQMSVNWQESTGTLRQSTGWSKKPSSCGEWGSSIIRWSAPALRSTPSSLKILQSIGPLSLFYFSLFSEPSLIPNCHKSNIGDEGPTSWAYLQSACWRLVSVERTFGLLWSMGSRGWQPEKYGISNRKYRNGKEQIASIALRKYWRVNNEKIATVIDSAEASLQALMRRRSSTMASLEFTPPVTSLQWRWRWRWRSTCLDDEDVLVPDWLPKPNCCLIVAELIQDHLGNIHLNFALS